MNENNPVFVNSIRITEPQQFKGILGAETYNIEYSIQSKQFTGSANWINLSLGKDFTSPKSEITIRYRNQGKSTVIKSNVMANAHFPFLLFKESPFISNWDVNTGNENSWTWESNFHESVLLGPDSSVLARIEGKPWSELFQTRYLQTEGLQYRLLKLPFLQYLKLFFKSGMKSNGIGGVGIEQIPPNLTIGQVLSLLVISTTFSS